MARKVKCKKCGKMKEKFHYNKQGKFTCTNC